MNKLLLALIFLLLAFLSGFQTGERRAQYQAEQRQLGEQRQWQTRLTGLAQQQKWLQLQHDKQVQSLERNLEAYRQHYRQRIVLPAAWRLQHDAAANLSAPAQPATGAADRALATDDLAALDTISHNYARCQQWREALIGWQDWYALASHATTVSGSQEPVSGSQEP
ncbi:hypothetical protein [Chromobacterium violaceum]|uniref:hypothetical protein n=1 Tax=Chromobacterium violaceum TaxID=536 RepID=UPI00155D92FD|nr:hypothetical protein [Chromobacterium violaceum]QRO35482.1 hypothetical protein I6K04_22665 [Chromobacterium violaceum]QRQ19357.1 hypothetical protein I6K03_22705 [Chromobacterium violaceum]